MKKVLAIMLALLMVAGLAACGEKKQEEEAAPTYKFGMGVSVETSVKNASAEADGQVESDPTIAVILVDGEGKIAQCRFDVAQVRLGVTAAGEVTGTDTADSFRTKQEKKEDYGMAKASKLEKGEWYQQADFLAEYLIGKTLEEVQAIKLEDGYAVDEDLRAGCTMGHMNQFFGAVADAYDRLVDAGEAASITLGVTVDFSSSKNATAEAAGTAEIDSNIGATALDKDGKITAASLDVTQMKFAVAADGTVTDAANKLSKWQLKENYGMSKASKLEKGEWYQQSEAFSTYLVGKTLEEVKGIELEDGYAVDEDLRAGCTMGHLNQFVEAFVKGM